MVGTMEPDVSHKSYTKARHRLLGFTQLDQCRGECGVGTDGNRLPDTGRQVRLLDDSQTLFRFARPPTRSGVVSRQQFLDTVFQRLEMRVDDSRNSQWVDIAQIVVHEDIAEAADFASGYFGAASDKVCRLRSVASYKTSSSLRSPRAWIRRILATASKICCA